MSDQAVAARPGGTRCGGCGALFPAALLSCPQCQRLVHADALRALQQRAQEQAAQGDREAELMTWREVLSLLPAGSRQHEQVQQKLEALGKEDAGKPRIAPAKAAPPTGAGKLAGLTAVGLLLWKFKAVLAFVLTKGKLLLLGFTKLNTVLSMALSVGVYWSIWGFQFALGFVLSLYVHEIGHVVALRRLGIAASAPMFIPGLGAFVRLKQYPASPSEDARVGLAGPIWGLGAALACLGLHALTGEALFAALARTGAWINLFNLMPIASLDGGRGFRALDRRQRWLAIAVIGGAFLLSHEYMLAFVGIAAVARVALGAQPERGDQRAFLTYTGLIAALAWLAAIEVPGAGAAVSGGSTS